MDHLLKTMKRLANHYPSIHTKATLADIAGDYFEAFKNWKVDVFNECCAYHLKISPFFPKIADLYDAYEHVTHSPKRNSENLLPEPDINNLETKAQAELNLKLLKITMKAVNKEISFEEALKLMEEERKKPLINK